MDSKVFKVFANRALELQKRISAEQVDFLAHGELQGGFCCVAYGAKSAIAIANLLYSGIQL